MIPNAENILFARSILAGFIRFYGIVSSFYAIHHWMYEIEFAIGNYRFSTQAGSSMPAAYQQGLAAMIWEAMSWSTLALLALGLVCFVCPHRIARALIRVSKQNRCPGCNYALDGITLPQCPECGLELTEAFVHKGSGEQSSGT